MKLHSLLVPLALLPLVASAQTTIYSTTFSSGALNPGTYATGDYAVLSTRANTPKSLATGAFSFGLTAATSASVEAQVRFADPASAVTLAVGDAIQLKIVFTATNNILSSTTTNSSLNVGLYNAATGSPTSGLAGTGSSALLASTGVNGFETGFVQSWSGYVGRFGHTSTDGLTTVGTSLLTRPAQSAGATGSSRPQDLVLAGAVGGSYNNPAAVTIATAASPSNAAFSLTNLSQYTITYLITQSTLTNQTFDLNLYSGTDTSASAIQFITGSLATNSVTQLTDTFNAFAIGYRYVGTSAASSITLNSVAVTSITAIPEPSTFAALAGVAGLGLAAGRRRRRG